VGSHFARTKAVAPHSAARGGFFFAGFKRACQACFALLLGLHVKELALALKPNLNPEPAMLQISDDAGFLQWRDIFLNDHPVELEIGSGKGTFLLAAATAFPDHNFIGIEWARAYCDFAADRVRRHQLTNARLVRADANWWIRSHVPDQSLSALHVYFPDPWPKARHHKRRLIQLPFLQQAARILIPGGILRIVTDHADYFEHIQAVTAQFKPLEITAFTPPLPMADGLLVGTNFEKKYIQENRSFNSIALTKPAH
jgi:tRNA (guanine-N7-)-methyltransferase